MYFSTGFLLRLGKFDPVTKKLASFNPLMGPVLDNLEPVNDLTSGPDGVSNFNNL